MGSGTLGLIFRVYLHEAVPDLIRATTHAFHGRHDMELLFYAFPDDAEKNAAVLAAGGRRLALANRLEIYSL